ncbi:MAG: MBL fold metallo-hydrolase [Bacillota bacterium]
MKIKWWGHATFLITTSDNKMILTDPYNEELPYKKITDKPDYVTVSHDHFDHNAVDLLEGSPEVIRENSGFEDDHINFEGISVYHDDAEGNKRGENNIFIITTDEFKIAHFGDLGHELEKEQLSKLKDIDILLIPVGGNYTIDAKKAKQIVDEIKPKVILPMHYKTDILDFPITGVDEFLSFFEKESIEIIDGPEVEIKELPSKQKLYVLDHVR